MRSQLPEPAPLPSCLNIAALRSTPVTTSPFTHLICPNAINPSAHNGILLQFPRLPVSGQYSVTKKDLGGPVFRVLLDELRAPQFSALIGEKLGVPLPHDRQMITIRGHSSKKDGAPHTDSKTRIATALLYLNENWNHEGGMIRVLNSDRVDDFTAEVPPTIGHMLAFRRSDNSFHGHLPYVGERRAIQIQWMNSSFACIVAAFKMWRKEFFNPVREE